jgi:fucose permease
MSFIERRFRAAYAVLFGSFVLFGISVTVIGAALPRVLADFGWDYLSAGFVIASGSIGYFLSAYVAGRMVDRIGFRASMAIGLALDGIGLLVFAMTGSVLVNAFLYFVIGVGQGFVEVAVNWSVVKMAPEASGRPMSLMHGAFSIGAVAGPLATGALIAAAVPWGFIYRIIGGLFIALLAASSLIPIQGLEGSASAKHHHRAELYGEPTFWLGFVVLMLYVGVEMGLSNWLSEYFVAVLGSTAALGAFTVSAFWMGLLAGRFGVPLVYHGPRHDAVLFVLSSILTVATLVLAIVGFTGGIQIAFAASAIAGFGCSCVYPVSMSLVGEAFPDAQGEAMGFASAGGGLGAFLFPLATAFVAKSWGLRAGYISFIFLALAVLGACVMLSLAARRRMRRRRPAPDAALVPSDSC